MTRTIFTVAAALALTHTGTACADVTPRNVWDQWSHYIEGFGYQIDTPPVEEGRNLRFPDFQLTIDIPANPASGQRGGTITVSLGTVTLTDQGDGTVSVDIPATLPLVMTGDTEGEGDFDLKGQMTSANYRMIASGSPDDITYDFAADKIGLTIDELTTAATTRTKPGLVTLDLTGADGTTRIAGATGDITLEQDMSVDRLSYSVDIQSTKDDTPGHIRANGGYANLTSTATATIPEGFDPLRMTEGLANGYAVEARMTYDAGQTTLDFADPDQSLNATSTSQSGSAIVALDRFGLTYDLGATQLDFSLESPELPFPVASTIGAVDFGLRLPVSKGETLQDFTARIGVTDLTLPDQAWALLDAGNMLPHDPVTAQVETSGKMRLFVDMLDDTQMAALATEQRMPAEITNLTLNSLLVQAGGATIAATGDFDIDNDQPSRIMPALPAMDGQLDLRLTGVTTLLGKLGQMGVLPLPQAMIATGMIQQLGKPENGPDDLSAKVEITKSGALTINGAPMPLP